MKTPFAVATTDELWVASRLVKGRPIERAYDKHLRTRMTTKKWMTWRHESGGVDWTDAGQVAFQLRQILGPDRELTKAQARALKEQITPARHFRALVKLGLLDEGDALTPDGEVVVTVLFKYNVETN